MEEEGKNNHSEALNIESANPTTAHSLGNDTWKQAGLLLVTCFNCGWILSFSSLMMVPLGWTWGIIGLVVIGYFTAYANWLLAEFDYVHDQRFIRYRDIMGYLFGKQMYYVTCFLQFLTMLLGNMGFILLGGRALKELNMVFSESPLRLQYFIIITGFTYFLFAFGVPNISAMRVWLGVSAVLTSTYVIVLLVALVNDGKVKKHKDYEVRGSTEDKIFNVFGAISAIIACNTAGMLLEIQSTLRKPAVKNMRKALYAQYSAGLIVYYGVSVVAYWAYGAEVSDYIPKSLSGPKWAKALINSAVFVQNVVSQHLFIQPIHEALDTRFLKLDEGTNSRENVKRRFLLRALLFTGNTVVTAAIPFMGDFINLLGSFTLIPLTFIFPSMIFIKVKGKKARAEQKAWHWTIIIVSSLIAVATTISAIRLIIKNVRDYNLFADQ